MWTARSLQAVMGASANFSVAMSRLVEEGGANSMSASPLVALGVAARSSAHRTHCKTVSAQEDDVILKATLLTID